jgi:cytochrome b subunit of formate dehydrogenase
MIIQRDEGRVVKRMSLKQRVLYGALVVALAVFSITGLVLFRMLYRKEE